MSDTIGARTLRELSRVIFARLGMVLAIVLLITAGTLAACLVAQKHYRSAVTFLVKEPRPLNPTAQEVSPDRSLQVFLKTQQEVIKSDTVLARTVLVLLDPESAAAKAWRQARQDWQRDNSKENWAAFTNALAGLDAEVAKHSADPVNGAAFREAVRRFKRNIQVETPGGEQVALSEVFTVKVVQPEPVERALTAADLLAQNYIDRYRETQAESSINAADFTRARLESLRTQRLAPAEQALREFVEKELDSPSDLGILEQLSKSGTEAGRQIIVRRFREEMITNDAELAAARQLKKQLLEQLPAALWESATRTDDKGEMTIPSTARLDALPDESPVLTETVTIIPEETLKNNVVVQQLKSKEVDLLIELNRLQVEFNPGYRGVQDKLVEIARARRQVLKELIGEARALDIKSATLAARQAEIGRKLDDELARLNKTTTQLVRYNELQNEVSLAREEYSKTSSELAAALAYQDQQAGAITINVLDPPRLPDAMDPAYPKTALYTLLAAAVGLLLAIAYAFLADHFDHTLSTIEGTERYLGVPVVGSIGRYHRALVN